MAKPNNSKTKWIWLSVLILLVCVAATTIAFVSRLDSFLLDDEGAISLITENTSGTDNSTDETEDTQGTDIAATQAPTTEQEPTSNTDTSGTQETDPATTTPQVTQPPRNPGFEASDDNTVWSTNTQVEIFRISYVNGEQVITVNSDNGDKVIAPGTENSYTFKLKNTGNVALDYTVEVDAYFTPADIEIPITGRLNRYDGKWVVGGKDEYANVPVLDAAEDNGTLGAGKYTYHIPESVAADGSTVFECYYDRNYYLIQFDLNGGYGVDPIYARYGTPFIVNDPIRHGYTFKGWKLIAIDTDGNGEWDDTLPDDAATELVSTIPAYNYYYQAQWETVDTEYTVVYWLDDNYLGSRIVSEKSGEYVSGSDDLASAQICGVAEHTHSEDNGWYKFTVSTDETDYENKISKISKAALYTTDVVPQYGQQLLTLSTCYGNSKNDRLVVIAIENNIYG